jgi:molybdopterin-guanine dinucleotide biosynthesis protein A
MGREKALTDWRGMPLIAHVAAILRPIFPQICVVTSKTEVAAAAQLPAILDQFERRGPLGGIHAALSHFEAPTFIVACDMPFLNRAFIEYLSRNFESKALVPLSENGIEPLHAIYDGACLPAFETYLRGEAKTPSLRRVCDEVGARFVSEAVPRAFDPQLRCFSNWNRPEEVENGHEAAAT